MQRRAATNPGLWAAALILASCGGEPEKPKRTLAFKFQDVARRFGDAVIAKKYREAFSMMAADYQIQVGWDEFEKSISRYRDHVPGSLQVTIEATEEDPSTLKDDTMVGFLVPEAQRSKILDEAVLHFDPEGDEEGWALVMWFVEENGAVRILNYYQDD
jgi:hypothetical protein